MPQPELKRRGGSRPSERKKKKNRENKRAPNNKPRAVKEIPRFSDGPNNSNLRSGRGYAFGNARQVLEREERRVDNKKEQEWMDRNYKKKKKRNNTKRL